MHYLPGESTKTFDDRSVPLKNPPQPSEAERAAAQHVCEQLGIPEPDMAGCVYDVAMTGDPSLAVRTASFLQEFRPSLATVDVVAPPKGPTSTSTAEPGRKVEGSIDKPGEQDIHTFTGRKGGVVYIRAGENCQDKGLYWHIRRSDKGSIGGVPGICQDIGRIKFEATGTYQIVVADLAGDKDIGDYAFEIVSSTPDQVADISVGSRAAGSIDRPGSLDAYRLRADRGQTVTLRAECKSEKLLWALKRPDGSTMGGIPGSCSDIGPITFDTAGTHRIEVFSLSDDTGDYAFTVRPS